MAKIEVIDDILFYAFRYALGRSTYVVTDVCSSLTENWNNLSDHDKLVIHKEINDAIVSNRYGMEQDRKNWENILLLK